jgi:succinoglycan biosynthesis protein ExoA
MPIRNEAEFIARTLASVLQQGFPQDQFEILVVDGQSTDGTPAIVAEIAGRHPGVQLLENPKRWSSAARNIGIRAAQGEFILIVDGHCELVDPEYLSNLVAAFRRSGADCIGRPQPLEIEGASSLQRAIAAARRSPLGHHPESFIYSTEERIVPAHSVAVAYRRQVFDQVGLFDERFDACEDVELNHRIDRAGLRCFFTPKVAVPYQPRNSFRGLFRQLVRYGKGRVRLARKHADTRSVKTFIPALWVVSLIVGPIAAWYSPVIFWTLVSTIAIYLVAVAAATAIAVRDIGDPVAALLVPLVFPTIHIASGWGQLVEFLAGPRNLRE